MATPRPRRGRVPQHVYWVRRTVVLVVAFALVFGIARLLGGLGSDGSPDKASVAGSSTGASAGARGPAQGPVAPTGAIRTRGSQTLLPPTGECDDSSVSVLPVVNRVYGGRAVGLHLQLEGTQPSCTFQVSPDTLVVKITSGTDRIWSTQDCPRAIRTDSVVVRSGAPTDISVAWSGRRSDDSCSGSTGWALPGFYHVYAAALGSAPADVQFEVVHPRRTVITKTAHPHPHASRSASASPTTKTRKHVRKPTPSPTPSHKASGGTVCGGDNAAGTC